ncbi:cytosolic non-specific dipeptidase-like isoform X2 [Belonocnema kinseyi]|uniref:cytosolic non-specific dipeptidase-like isoform X2 n=1 Tax=Belonocnema kinseyi TaxID=2817044 RepID=UPI00143DF84D|nr:cytosolic non-specific dipeptidase-like isoform X2 [Belonocnema kinseyi]
MPTPPEVIKCYKYIDNQQKKYVEELRKIVGIPTISSNLRAHKQISALIHWLESRLKKLGFTVALKNLGNYVPHGQAEEMKIPFLVLGTLGNDTNKKTLFYYCHLDVLNVKREKWATMPFELVEKNGKLYGRGTAKMKGPLLSFLHAIDCYKELGLDLPINIKIFCGRILVPNFYDDVMPITPEEEYIYHQLKINLEDYKKNVGVTALTHEEKVMRTLMHVWRHPCFNLHFINTPNKCDCTVQLAIPKKVSARFSVSIVPNQDQERIHTLILEHLRMLLRSRCTPNNVSINVHNSLDPWYENYLHWNYKAAKIAIKQVFKEEANLTREGKGFPILLKLRKALPKKNILVLPLVNNEANIHSEDENISIKNYIEGTKLLANYFHQLGNVSK